jgi:hypothetical protein
MFVSNALIFSRLPYLATSLVGIIWCLSASRSPFKVTPRMAKSLLDVGPKRLSGFEPRLHDTQKQIRNMHQFGDMLYLRSLSTLKGLVQPPGISDDAAESALRQ